jgi:type I restriction enzyme M protein
MVELVAPSPKDLICDPACGTSGFLVAAGEYLREKHPEIFHDSKLRKHFHTQAFHGFDFDNTMLRIGSMNMLLHGVENPDIRYRDSLSQDHAGDEEAYTVVLAIPLSRAASTTRTPPRTCSTSSRPRKPSCSFWPCSCACSSPAAERP